MATGTKTAKVTNIKTAAPRTQTDPTTGLVWEETKSDTVEAFAYVAQYGDLLVRFRSGGSYVYKNVQPELVKRLRRSHPWHEIGPELRNPELHPFERLGSIRTRPLKGRAKKQ